jgi:hypothetical protein
MSARRGPLLVLPFIIVILRCKPVKAGADYCKFAARTFVRTGCLMLLALLATPAWGQSPSPPSTAMATFSPEIDARCPAAVHEAKELRSHMKTPRVHTNPTRPALRENLLLMANQDQEARAFLHSPGSRIDPSSPELSRMREVDSANLKRLKHIVNQDGFPTAAMVGLDGVNAAWLLTVHAVSDPDFQERVLQLATEHVRRGEVRSDQVALLTDDLLAGRGKPQRYGTNFEWRDGELQPAPIEDATNVDKLRRAAGLGTLANYACVLRAMHF